MTLDQVGLHLYSGGIIDSIQLYVYLKAANPLTFWSRCISLISPVTYNGKLDDSFS